jgi:hypothetical protein
VAKTAYLGATREYTVETMLGSVFVVSPDVDRPLPVGADVGLRRASRGVSVLPGTGATQGRGTRENAASAESGRATAA